jgi:hypothetical protein
MRAGIKVPYNRSEETAMGKHSKRDQFYVFTNPADTLPVWAEVFLADGTHTVAPTPYGTVTAAVAGIKAINPGHIVDELCLQFDIDSAREMAGTMRAASWY